MSESEDADYRPPHPDIDGRMSPTSHLNGLERRVCPNCRLFFDVGEESDDVYCSDACRTRHKAGDLIADGGQFAKPDPTTRARQKLSVACGLSANGHADDARAEIREAMQLLDAAREARDDAEPVTDGGRIEAETNHSCANCGAAVSPKYHRANRDERTEQLHACPQCTEQWRRFSGAFLHDRDGERSLRTAREGSDR